MADLKTVAIFDLDRTLTRGPTFSSYLLNVAKEDPDKYLYVFAVLFQMLLYVLKLKSRKTLKEYMLSAFVKGLSKRELARHTDRFLDKLFERGFHGEGLKILNDHKKKGHMVGLATASMDFYANEIAKRLGLDFAITTTSVWEKSCLVPIIKGENCYGYEKAKRVQVLLAKHKVKDVWFYSDSATDLPTFALADFKVAVNPSLKLKKVALKEGFDIQHWK